MKISKLNKTLFSVLIFCSLVPIVSFGESTSPRAALVVKKRASNQSTPDKKVVKLKKKKDVKEPSEKLETSKKTLVAPAYDKDRFNAVYRDGLKYRDQRRTRRVQKRVKTVRKRIEKLKEKIEKAQGKKQSILKGRLKENEWKLRRLLKGTTEAKGLVHRRIKTKRFAKYLGKNEDKKNKKKKKSKKKKDDVVSDESFDSVVEVKKPNLKAKASTLLKAKSAFALKKPATVSNASSRPVPKPSVATKPAVATPKKIASSPANITKKPTESNADAQTDNLASDSEEKSDKVEVKKTKIAQKPQTSASGRSIKKATDSFVGTTHLDEREKAKSGAVKRRGGVAKTE